MHTIGNMASVSTWLNWQCNHWLHVQCTLFAPWLLQPIGYMGNAHNWQNGHCFLYGNIAIATIWLHGQCTKLATWSVLPHGLHGQCNKFVTWPIHTNINMATWPLQQNGYLVNAQPMHFHGYMSNAIHCSCLYPLHMASCSFNNDHLVYLIHAYKSEQMALQVLDKGTISLTYISELSIG